MADEINSVDDIVVKKAAEIKDSSQGADSSKTNTGDQGKGAGEEKPPGEEKKDLPATPVKPEDKDPLKDFLKEVGVESLEQLKEKLKPKSADKSPEEIVKEDQLYRAGLQSYAVESGLMKLEDFESLNSVKAKKDTDLALEVFSESYLEDNPDAKPDEIKEAFDLKYDVSEDSRTKKWAEKQISKLAAERRTPLESSFTDTKKKYDEERTTRAAYPDFDKRIKSVASEFIPDKLEVFKQKDGDAEVSAIMEITDVEKKEISDAVDKRLRTKGVFELHRDGKSDEIANLAKAYAQEELDRKLGPKKLEKVAEKFLEHGRKTGSKVGATNPFPLQQSKGGQASGGKPEAAQEVMDNLQGKQS